MPFKWTGEKPQPRVGKCVVCSGVVTETFTRVPNNPDIIGPGSGSHWVSSGLSCTDCGIKYAHLPNQ